MVLELENDAERIVVCNKSIQVKISWLVSWFFVKEFLITW